jgi:hypothetical protein
MRERAPDHRRRNPVRDLGIEFVALLERAVAAVIHAHQ